MNEETKQVPDTAGEPMGPEVPDTPESPGEEQLSSPPRRRSVFAYLAILFGTAFLLLLFAYLMQQRDSQEIMGNLSDLRESMGSIQSIDELVEENRTLREEKDTLQARLDELEKQAGELETELAASEELAAKRFTQLEQSQTVIDAFSTLVDLRQLYEDGDMEDAKELLDSVKAFAYEAKDHVEEGFEYHFRLSHSTDPDLEAALEAYPPLVEWRELKQAVLDALAQEEDAG